MALFTYGISVWGGTHYDKYLAVIDKFQKRGVCFGYLRQVTPVAHLVEISDNKNCKSITGSTYSSSQLTSCHPTSPGCYGIEVTLTFYQP